MRSILLSIFESVKTKFWNVCCEVYNTNMFKASTEKIEQLAVLHKKTIRELEKIFKNTTNVYVDYANVIHWSDKLKWHIDLKRLKQFLNSFDTVKAVKFYNGTIIGDTKSEEEIKEIESFGYQVITKPVKKMHLSIDVSGIPASSPVILQNFIKKPLLKKLDMETIEFLNNKLKEFNDLGIKFVEHWKCNFDVEIGRDLYLDYERNGIENYVIWSGDSDFVDPIDQLLKDKKQVVIFATARRITPELNKTGVKIYEIWKIKDFICWKKEMSESAKNVLNNAKGAH